MVGPFFRLNFRSISSDFWTFCVKNYLKLEEIVKKKVAKVQYHRICARFILPILHNRYILTLPKGVEILYEKGLVGAGKALTFWYICHIISE